MNLKYNNKRLQYLIIAVAIGLLLPVSSFASQYNALKGLDSVRAVFDVRVGNPKVAAVHLDLIHKTFKDPNLHINSKKPEVIVVFMGPAVKLVSKTREGLAPEAAAHLDTIAGIVSKMAKDGIKLEICVAAVELMGIDPDSILPEINKVDNGWISAIGYQLNGYALISDF